MWLPTLPNALVAAATAVLTVFPRVVLGQSQGGTFCVSSNLLCVNAVVGGSTVTYQLSSTYGFNEIGWMAVGFGTGMLNSPLVLVWPNDDGTITLSQRQTAVRTMPQVVRDPAQVATVDWQYSNLKTETTTIAFQQALPASTSDYSRVHMIWAVATSKPSGSAVDATIAQHIAQGAFTMDLTGSVPPLVAGPYTGTSTVASATSASASQESTQETDSSDSSSSTSIPLSSDEKKLVRHGILMTIGTLILLPIGILIPRYARTIPALQSKWFRAHAIVQLWLSAPLIFAGWILGYQYAGDDHFEDTHTKVGLAFLILYCIQIVWGLGIHFIKPNRKPVPAKGESASAENPIASSIKYRLPQNYAHAIIGLALIVLAFYNVHRGYDYEWQYATGRPWTHDLNMVDHWWKAWVVIIPVAYVAGLLLLPRQWRQEYAARNPATSQTQAGSGSTEHESDKA